MSVRAILVGSVKVTSIMPVAVVRIYVLPNFLPPLLFKRNNERRMAEKQTVERRRSRGRPCARPWGGLPRPSGSAAHTLRLAEQLPWPGKSKGLLCLSESTFSVLTNG